MQASPGEADKAAFFDQLYALDQPSDKEGNSEVAQTVRKNSIIQPTSSASIEDHGAKPLSSIVNRFRGIHRTASEPVPASVTPSSVIRETPVLSREAQQLRNAITDTASREEIASVEETSLQPHIPRGRGPPRRTVSAPTPSAIESPFSMSNSTSSLGKRKRKQPAIKLVPEAQQIFRNLTFFYIPNDDIAPVRRARIRKALERGAQWTTTWAAGVITHIIVDKAITYQEVITYLHIPSIPRSVILVLENYPLDCIQFRAILDHTQRQYQVGGYQAAGNKVTEENPQRIQESQTSDRSLQLKPTQSKPGKWDYVPPRATPPRSENSTQNGPVVLPRSQITESSSPGTWLVAAEVEAAAGMGRDGAESEDRSAQDFHHTTAAELNQERQEDALDEMIREARRLEHLPLDDDDDDRPPSRDQSTAADDSDHDRTRSPEKRRAPLRKNSSKEAHKQENFSCMKGGTGKIDDSNPNARTIAILQEMADYYTRINDTWRPIAYRKAITTLRQQTNKIATSEEAFALPFIGQRLALKIEEIVTTDRLRRLENAKAEPSDHVLQKFMGIYGVGFNQANKWLHSGYTTLEELTAHAQLTDNQRLGIEHYDDFQTRIPRDEVTALGAIVKAAAAAIDPDIKIIIGGSYRRGAASSGDIDCIITKPGTSTSTSIFPFLTTLVANLTAANFLVAPLAVPRAESGTKWHGCCVLPSANPPIWRRIDLLLVPSSELGAALIYFTGNDIFNRSIRLLASRKGMRLNQKGLYRDVMRGPWRTKLNEGELVEGSDERRIFEVLGVPWRRPEERIC
jgi:DNA polymerase IV